MIGLLQKKKIVNLPVSLKGNSKLTCGKRGPEQGYRRCLADITRWGFINAATQARRVEALPVSHARGIFEKPNTYV